MRMKLIVEYELAERSISLPFMNQLNIVKLSEWNKAKANQWMMNELISWARLKSYYYNSIIDHFFLNSFINLESIFANQMAHSHNSSIVENSKKWPWMDRTQWVHV